MAADPLLQFFTFSHLRDEQLQAVSRHYAELAQRTLELCPDNAERHEALRKLLEAKDCAVRSLIFKPQSGVFVPHAGSPVVEHDVPDPKPTAPS